MFEGRSWKVSLLSDVKWLHPDHSVPEAAKLARASGGSRRGRMGTILDQVASTVDDGDAKNAKGERGDAVENGGSGGKLWRRRSCG